MENLYGLTCSQCGGNVVADDRCYCAACDGLLCIACTRCCERCGHAYCTGCAALHSSGAQPNDGNCSQPREPRPTTPGSDCLEVQTSEACPAQDPNHDQREQAGAGSDEASM
jgi:hypothetical protein